MKKNGPITNENPEQPGLMPGEDKTAGSDNAEKFYSITIIQDILLDLKIGFTEDCINIIFYYYFIPHRLSLLDKTTELYQRLLLVGNSLNQGMGKETYSDKDQKMRDPQAIAWLAYYLDDILIETSPSTHFPKKTIDQLFLCPTRVSNILGYIDYSLLDCVSHLLIYARTKKAISEKVYTLILEVKNTMLAWVSLIELKPYLINFSLALLITGDPLFKDNSSSNNPYADQIQQRARFNGTDPIKLKLSEQFSLRPLYMSKVIKEPRVLCTDITTDGFEVLLSDSEAKQLGL